MQKHWDKSKVDLYFEDAENEKLIRRSFNNAIETPSDDQITAFTNAVDSLSEYPSAHTVLVQEYQYVH
jgi:hypothetical protein